MTPPAPMKYAVLCYIAWEGANSCEFDTYEEALAEYAEVLKTNAADYTRVELVAVLKREIV